PGAAAGGALLVRDEELHADWVVANVVPLATAAARLATMRAAARHLVPRDADEALARIVLEAGGAAR
ncbi:UDP-N-acetylglucosamine--N-acetylmuramyl-(pentapeptide) pyrophosphoryl-undecaprenol N-acetylglucosamine transferase, partial [Nocardioides sp. SOB44]|nr:UDP-N-acetylglucosamine--N-acetylmuramyl-(pentapeptide) pyrophosphoryl-undecaprenol N-acetylglucosamine transferase [Nocardioides cremeus]